MFGLVHLMNPAATVMSAVSINVETGVLLAAYHADRRLWMSMGFIAPGTTQSGVFSGIVSGLRQAGLIKPVIDGPTLLTTAAASALSPRSSPSCAVHGDENRSAGPATRRGHIDTAFLEAQGWFSRSEEKNISR